MTTVKATKVNEAVLLYCRKHVTRNSAYLYNNRLFTSGVIGKSEYELNREFIRTTSFYQI